MLVINQLAGIYECRSEVLITYYEKCVQQIKEFKDFRLEHVPQLHNEEANRLAQHTSDINSSRMCYWQLMPMIGEGRLLII